MSETTVKLGVWNLLSQKAKLNLTKNHKAIVQPELFTSDGKAKCGVCGSVMQQVDTYTWKWACRCVEKNPKLKDLRLSIG